MAEESLALKWSDPPPPEALIPDAALWPWIIASILLLTLLTSAWLVLKRKKSSTPDPTATRNAAFSSASNALASITTHDAREAAIQASLILRNYLASAASDPALFETHEEFITRHDSLHALNEPTRRTATSAFSRLASLKYTPDSPESSSSEILSSARSLLVSLHQGFSP